METRILFTLFVALVGVQRLIEVRKSNHHAAALLAAGGREHASWQVPALKVLHGSWLLAACAEVWLLETPFRPWLALTALGVFGGGQQLRLAAMQALGPRWTIRVVTLPGVPPIMGGIYRYIRHPNYLGVGLEVVSLPLVHGAIYTAVVFSLMNALLLASRIRAEEAALDTDNAYMDYLGRRSRFLPASRHDRRSS
jgi:methyltransferase